MEMKRTVELPDGTLVPAIGQGSWMLGEGRRDSAEEEAAILTGIREGMTLIDTAEMYGEGLSEDLIGRAIENCDREDLFLVSKVYPHNADREHILYSCEASMQRLGVDYLDLYLLHWRGRVPLQETVECMEELVQEGFIKRWGVSNFDVDDMEELFSIPGGEHCAVNQVLYHVASRGIEYDLLPWMRDNGVPAMAYCPLAQAGTLRRGLLENKVLRQIAAKHEATVAQVMLAFVIRKGDVVAIPRSGSAAHVEENALAASLVLTDDDLAAIDREFPAPTHKVPLDIV